MMRAETAVPPVGDEELPCAVMELVSKTVLSSPAVLGCLVVRLVAGELGMVVIPSVDDMRLGPGTRVVRGVKCMVEDWEESVVGAGVLAEVLGVDRKAVGLGVGP